MAQEVLKEEQTIVGKLIIEKDRKALRIKEPKTKLKPNQVQAMARMRIMQLPETKEPWPKMWTEEPLESTKEMMKELAQEPQPETQSKISSP